MIRLTNKLLILILIISVSTANAGRLISPFFKFMYENASGETVPANGHILYFYDAGTTTPKATYSNVEETVSNGTSITLSSEGWANNVFGTGAYKIVWKDTSGVTVDEFDDVDADSAGLKQFDTYSSIKTYSLYDIVETSGGAYYRSLNNSNYNNNPPLSLTYWEQINLVLEYNSSKEYTKNQWVSYSGALYKSLQSSNTGHTPVTQTDWWKPLGELQTYSQYADYFEGDIVKESRYSNTLYVALMANSSSSPHALTEKGYWEKLSLGRYVFNDIDNTDSPYTTNGWTCEALSINTTSGSCTVNAHSSPNKDDTIVIDDALKQFAVNNVIFASGDATIDNTSSPYTCSTAGARYEFIYDSTNDNWRVIISN